MQEWHGNKIFLVTEAKTIIQTFKQVFGGLCVIFNREYVDLKSGQAVGLVHIDRTNDRYI